MASSRWRSLAVNLLLFALLATGIRLWQQRDMTGSAPALVGTTIAGQRYALAEHRTRPVLVHFWASWCPVCRMEQESIAAIALNDPVVITVAMQSGNPAQISAYLNEQGISLPGIGDPDGSIARAWGVHGVPASFIVAPDGQIRFVEVGYTTGIGLRIRRALAGI